MCWVTCSSSDILLYQPEFIWFFWTQAYFCTCSVRAHTADSFFFCSMTSPARGSFRHAVPPSPWNYDGNKTYNRRANGHRHIFYLFLRIFEKSAVACILNAVHAILNAILAKFSYFCSSCMLYHCTCIPSKRHIGTVLTMLAVAALRLQSLEAFRSLCLRQLIGTAHT